MRTSALRELEVTGRDGAEHTPSAAVDAAADRPAAPPSLLPVRPRDIALCLTAVALLLRPMGPWFVRPVILALSVLMILSPGLLRSAWAWGAIAVLIAVRIADDWPLADNHI